MLRPTGQMASTRSSTGRSEWSERSCSTGMRAFDLVSDAQMNRRRDLAQAFYEAVLDSGEHPYIASDEATTWDISTDDEASLIDRYQRHHGAELLHDHLALPLWKLLHYLEAH